MHLKCRTSRLRRHMNDPRAYPDRPYLAVSAAIVRDGHVLIVRRAKGAARGLYTLPGGVVESGETLEEAVRRETREETGIEIEPAGIVGHREVVMRDAEKKVERHFVILPFAARWLSGEPKLNDELSEARWLRPSELHGLKTTEGLIEIVAAAFARLEERNGHRLASAAKSVFKSAAHAQDLRPAARLRPVRRDRRHACARRRHRRFRGRARATLGNPRRAALSARGVRRQ